MTHRRIGPMTDHRRRFPPTPPRIYTAGGLEIGLPAGRRRRRRQRAPVSAGVILAILTLVAARPASAAQGGAAQGGAVPGPRSAPVTAIAEPIAIDGVLDEPAWRSAPPIGELVQRQPTEGAAPSERTTVTLLADRDRLYIGVLAFDSEPARVIGTQMARDAVLGADDRVEILLDTFRDQRSAFYFATNPAGALVDGLIANGQLNTEWDAIWDVRTRRTADGWVAEFAIPFKSLGFPETRSVWGFNVARHVYRKLEENRWSGARLDSPFAQVAEAGEITGLVGPDAGHRPRRPAVHGRTVAAAGRPRRDDGQAGPRPLLQHHAEPQADRHGQHRLRRDRGRRAADQPGAVLGAVPREARLLPAGRGRVRVRQHRTGAGRRHPGPRRRRVPVLQPPDRPLRRRRGADRRRPQADRDGRPHRHRRARRAHRRPARPRGQELLRRPHQAQPVPAVLHRRDGHRRQSRARPFGPDLRRGRAAGDVAFLGRPQNFVVNGYAARSVNEGVSTRDWSYGFSASYPNDV